MLLLHDAGLASACQWYVHVLHSAMCQCGMHMFLQMLHSGSTGRSLSLQHKCLRRGLLLSDYLFNICLLYTIGTQGAEALV